ncbi:MAG: TetR/AcrR family transcriptional regulator [Anaerolineales bacterium]|nr:TetR/AcrR family transcriptional regulator [Anaerolineales bacterium]
MTHGKESRADQLLETATLLFKEKGYHNTSMQDLADALGLQKGSLYYYIDSKEELLRELLEQATSILGARIDEIYAAHLSASEKLRRALENHGQAIMDNLNLVTVYLQEYRSLPPERLEEVLAAREHYEERLMQILQDGITSGEFNPVDVKMTVFGFLGMLNWTHQWFSPEGELTSEEIAAILADLALQAVSKKP